MSTGGAGWLIVIGMRVLLGFVLACVPWACTTGSQSTSALPTVMIAESGSAAIEETDEPEPPRAIRCVLEQQGWVHRAIELSHDELGSFVSVSQGDASLRLDNLGGTGALTVEDESWKLTGEVALERLDVFVSEPIWLRGAVLPGRTTPLTVRIAKGQIGLEGTFDVTPHTVGPANLHELRIYEPSVACKHMGLRPVEAEASSTLVEGIALEGRRGWTVSPGVELELGPRVGMSVGELKLQQTITARELARQGTRCWVGISLNRVTVLGWLDCRALGTGGYGRLGRSHRARPPRIRAYTPLVATLRCDKRVTVLAQRGDRAAPVGSIAPAVTIRASSETSTHFVVVSPRTLVSAEETRFAIEKSAAARDCTVTRKP